jgi:hypothetical protein
MKINFKRKNLIVGFLILFLISAFYVPTEIKQNGIILFLGYKLIWNVFGDISLRILLIEWLAIAVSFSALFAITGTDD